MVGPDGVDATTNRQPESHRFEAEVGRLLDIVANALYSNKDVFLRELISNASDACDKLRFAALTTPDLIAGDADFAVQLSVDAAARTLSVTDNGIGMDRAELVTNLGTIAQSGTAAFAEAMAQASAQGQDADKALSLIGQFGVGFYAAFTVADRVVVDSRKAGTAQGWRWESDGKGSFTVAESADAPARGTRVTLHLKEAASDYLEESRLRHIVTTYSDHIGLPVRLGDGEAAETLNTGSALWTRSKSSVTDDQYKEFYHHVAHAFDDPWATVHYKAEGVLEYTALLFVPGSRPMDLFDPERKPRVKLYVRRVFITDDCEALLPPWLRFLRGVVDSEDLPLNISREMLQSDPVVRKIRQGLVKRVLDDLSRRAREDADGYIQFWDAFGSVLKEGLYEATEHKDTLLSLARFASTGGEALTTLADYKARMKDGQEAIYYLTADSPAAARRSPQIEGFVAKGVEVLLLADPIDAFWVPVIGAFEDTPLVSVTQAGDALAALGGDADTPEDAETERAPDAALDALVALFKLTLKDQVKDVRLSSRLTDSPVCLASDAGDMDLSMERMLRHHNRLDQVLPRVLELNPKHALTKALAARVAADGSSDALAETAELLLDQARLAEGEPVRDPAAFAQRMTAALTRGLG